MTNLMEGKTPNNAAGYLFFEDMIRQFFSHQFKKVSATAQNPAVTFLDDMFGRFGDDTRVQIKLWFAKHDNISIDVNYPRADVQLPFIAIVNSNESESQSAYLDNYGGRMAIGPSSVQDDGVALFGERPRALAYRRVLSLPENKTTRIYIGTDDANSVQYVYAVAKALLLMAQPEFESYGGMRNIKMSGSDLEHHPELFPSFAYFKVITLQYEANFDVPLPAENSIGGIDLSLKVALFSQETTVPDPTEEPAEEEMTNGTPFRYVANGTETDTIVITFASVGLPNRASTNYNVQATWGGLPANPILLPSCPPALYQVGQFTLILSAAPQNGDIVMLRVEDM